MGLQKQRRLMGSDRGRAGGRRVQPLRWALLRLGAARDLLALLVCRGLGVALEGRKEGRARVRSRRYHFSLAEERMDTCIVGHMVDANENWRRWICLQQHGASCIRRPSISVGGPSSGSSSSSNSNSNSSFAGIDVQPINQFCLETT